MTVLTEAAMNLEDRVLQTITALGGRADVVLLLAKLNESHWWTNGPILGALFGIGVGRLYPVLVRLERRGQLSSEWVGDVFPRRRIYYRTSKS